MTRGITGCVVAAIASVVAACSPAPSPPSPPTVTVGSGVTPPAPVPAACEVVAAVLGPDAEPTIERRTAAGCRQAYDAFGARSRAAVWVQRVGGVGNDRQLTEIWDVPHEPGVATWAISFGIETDRATGHAEGGSDDDVQTLARHDACRQLGLSEETCRERARMRSTRTTMQIVNGESHAEATVEIAVFAFTEGEATGETKLDACRAAIRQKCRDGGCRDAALIVRRIDDVPLTQPEGWPPPKGLFGQPSTAPP